MQIEHNAKTARHKRPAATQVNRYLQVIAEHFGMTIQDLLSSNNKGGGTARTHTIDRQVAIYLLRKDLGVLLDDLATKFNRRRTTILRNLAHVERKLAHGSRRHQSAITEIRNQLKKV